MEAINKKLIAMALDCEGSITINLFRKRNNYLQMEPQILVFSNNNTQLMGYIESLCRIEFPSLRFYKARKGTTLRVYGNQQGLKFLKKLIPHLIGKKEKAKSFIKFVEQRRNQHHKIYSQKDVDLALSIRARPLRPWAIKFLRKRGYKI